MKKLFYFFIIIIVFISCKDDLEAFSVDLPAGAFRFTPAMGGAILTYTLPDDPEVVAVQVTYKDIYGKYIRKTGSNSTNQLVITGFNEAVSDIPAQITFLKRNDEESQPIDVTFSTLDSGPICFINNAEVASGWDGCTLTLDNPEGTTGMAHVFYLGNNPQDGKPDTILMESFPLRAGQDVKRYIPQQKRANHTIIVRAEDYRGYIVKERIWENIHAFNVEKLDPANFKLIYSNSLEVPEEKIGLQYLTDGDTKGTSWFQTENLYHYYTFISKENGWGADSEPMYIDLKVMRPVAEIRFYAYRYIGQTGFGKQPKPEWRVLANNTSYIGPKYFNNYLANKLPCSVTVYGCRENVDNPDWDQVEWEELSVFEDDPEANIRWTDHAVTCNKVSSNATDRFATLPALEKAAPIFKGMNIDIDKQGEGFRYIKIKFHNTYRLAPAYEAQKSNQETKYLTFHELEIYSNKD